jgi:CYTH domain-containing protein
MEIEKKYKVEKIPFELSKYDYYEITQGYITTDPVIRIRRKVLKDTEEYILCYKEKVNNDSDGNNKKSDVKVNINHEYETQISKKAFEKLIKEVKGHIITKTRYLIPYESFLIELDVFHGDYEGLIVAEVEFKEENMIKDFTVPSWFGKDLSGDKKYTNAYMSQNIIV